MKLWNTPSLKILQSAVDFVVRTDVVEHDFAILEGWEKRDALDIRRGEWLDRAQGVEKKEGCIVAIKTLSGSVYRGKVFVDATYEGDLMAAAGVSYAVGREAKKKGDRGLLK